MKRITMLLTIVFMLVLSMQMTYATETTENENTDNVPSTGSEAVWCDVEILLNDMTGVLFTDDVTVTFKDIASRNVYSLILEFSEYGNGNAQTIQVLANTTYDIEVSFEHSDLYSVTDIDGAEIDKIHATEQGLQFTWIVKKGGVTDEVAEEENTVIDIDTGNAEADEVFSKFINATRHIEHDQDWSGFLNIYDLYAENRIPLFETYAGRDGEEWLNMDSYEQFLWYELYLREEDNLHAGMYNFYYGSESNYVANSLQTPYSSIKLQGKEEAEAFKEIMMWQYNYIKENGSAFNFMTGLNYLEVNPDSEAVDPALEQEKASEQDEKDLEQLKEDFDADTLKMIEEEQSQEDKIQKTSGFWQEALEGLKDNVISILLLIALAVGLSIIVYKRKKLNVDGDEEK